MRQLLFEKQSAQEAELNKKLSAVAAREVAVKARERHLISRAALPCSSSRSSSNKSVVGPRSMQMQQLVQVERAAWVSVRDMFVSRVDGAPAAPVSTAPKLVHKATPPCPSKAWYARLDNLSDRTEGEKAWLATRNVVEC